MINSMKIDLKLYDNSFTTEAHIKCPFNNRKQISFYLNKDLKILSIKSNTAVSFKITEETTLAFRSPAQKVEITGKKPIRGLQISYAGAVQFNAEKKKNFNNIITKDIVSLSWYSVWFPQEPPFRINRNSVIIHNASEWYVLKAKYDAKNKSWKYSNPFYDPYNIVAYRKSKLSIISNRYMNIYTIERNKKEIFQNFSKTYENIMNYYNGNLFKRKHIRFLDVPLIAPAIIVPETAYVRRGLLWCSTFGETENEMIRLWAHETAHNWCHGADTNSWEDWLNETTAEWATLLFALRSDNESLFESMLLPKIKKYKELPDIRTADGSRPEGVHDKGTVLFYKVYLETDLETMETILRCFSDLKIKNTRRFLKKLKQKKLFKAAEIIENGLDKTLNLSI
ncbi:MAG: hypothetical protein K1V95_04955 [Eubacterium sp.]